MAIRNRQPKQHQQQRPLDAIDPAIMERAADAPLRALQEQLAQAKVELEAAHKRLAETRPVYEASKLDLERSLNRALIYMARDGEVAAAEQAVEQARLAFATAEAHADELERAVAALPSAITERRQRVQAQIAHNVRHAFYDKLTRLVEMVKAAKILSDQLDALYEQASHELYVNDLMRLPHGTLLNAVDLGPDAGFCDQAAGLTNNCVNPYLTNTRAGRNATSLAELWLQDVESWLAKTPEMREQEDQVRRVEALERDIERKRQRAADEVARAKLRALISERDHIPIEQVPL